MLSNQRGSDPGKKADTPFKDLQAGDYPGRGRPNPYQAFRQKNFMPFCRQCGKEQFNNPAFCSTCGTPQAAPPPSEVQPGLTRPVVPPPPMAGRSSENPGREQVLSVIPNLMKQRNLIKTDFFNIVITDRRVLCVDVNALVSAGAEEAGRRAKAENRGFFGSYNARMGLIWACDFTAQLGGMEPDEIIAKNPGSFAMPLEQVRLMNVSLVTRETGDDCEWNTESWEIRLDTGREKQVFQTRSDPCRYFTARVPGLLGNRLVFS